MSTSGFYDWSAREVAGPTERQVAEAELVELMRDIFATSDGNYGERRLSDLVSVGLLTRLASPAMDPGGSSLLDHRDHVN